MSFWIGGRAKILRRGGGAQYHFFIFIRPAEQNIINVFHNKVIFEIDVIKKMLISKAQYISRRKTRQTLISLNTFFNFEIYVQRRQSEVTELLGLTDQRHKDPNKAGQSFSRFDDLFYAQFHISCIRAHLRNNYTKFSSH